MNTYKIYAKPLQNNLGNDVVYVQSIHAKSKIAAVHSVRNAPDNRGFYLLDSYFAIKEEQRP